MNGNYDYVGLLSNLDSSDPNANENLYHYITHTQALNRHKSHYDGLRGNFDGLRYSNQAMSKHGSFGSLGRNEVLMEGSRNWMGGSGFNLDLLGGKAYVHSAGIPETNGGVLKQTEDRIFQQVVQLVTEISQLEESLAEEEERIR